MKIPTLSPSLISSPLLLFMSFLSLLSHWWQCDRAAVVRAQHQLPPSYVGWARGLPFSNPSHFYFVISTCAYPPAWMMEAVGFSETSGPTCQGVISHKTVIFTVATMRLQCYIPSNSFWFLSQIKIPSAQMFANFKFGLSLFPSVEAELKGTHQISHL